MSTNQGSNDDPRVRTAAEAALQPIAAEERAFGWRDHASLWFVFGIGLLVIQAGTYLVPIAGTEQALLAVVLGSAVGAIVLAWTARVGCRSGLSSAGLMYRALGRSFARLPILLNVLQLIGWGTYELVILRDGTRVLAARLVDLGGNGAIEAAILTALWGAALAALLSFPMVAFVERVINRVVLPLMLVALLWLTWQVLAAFVAGGPVAFQPPADARGGGLFAAIDLVAAFPVSWLPVVADYARHGKQNGGRGSGGAFTGTWTGIFIANAWGFALGVFVVSTAPLDSSLVAALALVQGGLAVLALVLLHELGNAYGSTYAAAASVGGLSARLGLRAYGAGLAVLCMLLAILLPIASMEPFLLLLSSVFVPLYGVILGRLGVSEEGGQALARPVDPAAVATWIAGIVLYQALGYWEPAWGSTLPTLVTTFALGWLTRGRGRLA